MARMGMATSSQEGQGGREVSARGRARARSRALPAAAAQPVRRVLVEEEYLATLGSILRRDFFPTLGRLEAQYDYLTAVERSDLEALRVAASRLSALEARGECVAAPDMSLDEFQAQYVTEDTHAFEELLGRLNSSRRAKFAKIFKASPLLADDPTRRLALLPSHNDPDRLSAAASRRATVARNTRIEWDAGASAGATEGALLQRDPDDIRYHYWKMVREHREADGGGGGGDGDSVRGSSVGSQISQMGGVGADGYDFVDTPAPSAADGTPLRGEPPSTHARKFRIPPTPRRELLGHSIASASRRAAGSSVSLRSSELLRSPAVQRLIRARTPRIGSVFDMPTPQRRAPQ